MQPESSPMQYAPEKPKGINPMSIIMIAAIGVLSLVVIGLAIWGYMQTSKLKDTQATLSALQADHTALTAERDDLSSNLAKTTSELEATKAELEDTKANLEATTAELETTKADLTAAKDEVSALQAKIDTALGYVNIFVNFWDDSFGETEDKVKETGDSDLLDLFDAYFANDAFNYFEAFFNGVVDGIVSSLE